MTALTAALEPVGRRRRHRVAIAFILLAAAVVAVVALAGNSQARNATEQSHSTTQQIHGLQLKGYVAVSCTPEGTLMVDPKTHQHITVKLA
jgi:ferric-dicitrate binding protein FerR (iron transport regulator)